MSKVFRAKEHIEALNAYKGEHRFFSTDEFKKACVQLGLPVNPSFFAELQKIGICIRIKFGAYTWQKDPIHYTKLQEAYNNYNQRIRGYSNTYANRGQKRDYQKEVAIEDAIQLLKENGYMVCKIM